jgi:hypothetical protein
MMIGRGKAVTNSGRAKADTPTHNGLTARNIGRLTARLDSDQILKPSRPIQRLRAGKSIGIDDDSA